MEKIKEITREISDDIVNSISKVIKAEKVILFGSYAKNEAGQESDLDLLVVCNGKNGGIEKRRKKLGNIYRSLSHIKIEKDILLFSTEEFEHWKNSINHMIANACKDGRILYER